MSHDCNDNAKPGSFTHDLFITSAVESFLAFDITKNILLPFCSLKCNLHQTVGYDNDTPFAENWTHRVEPDDIKRLGVFPLATTACDQADTIRVIYAGFDKLMPLWFVEKYYCCFDKTFRNNYSLSDCISRFATADNANKKLVFYE